MTRTPRDRDPRQRLTRDFDLELRSVSDAGVIEGYASVFNEVTSYGEIMAPGSFTRTLAAWKAKKRAIPVLWQHDAWEPVGVTTEIAEDEKGLRIKAQLVTEVQRAREAHALAKAGALGGLSIGFSIPALASDGQPAVLWDEEQRVEVFREVKLWEYSMVTFPANEAATIDEVRQHTAATRELIEAMRGVRTAIEARPNGEADAAALLREARALMLQATPARPARAAVNTRALSALLAEARALARANPSTEKRTPA